MANILFVEDDLAFAKVVAIFLRKNGYELLACHSVKEALNKAQQQHFDLLLLDYRLPDGTGLDVLQGVRQLRGAIPTVMMTSLNDIRTAVKAMRAGAFDYITKPVNHEELLMVLQSALQAREPAAPAIPQPSNNNKHIEGSSLVAKELYQMVSLVAPTDMAVLILGESGTGKEHIARSIHAQSKRAQQPFIAIDCGVQSNELAVSELFGHEKGAFTGASSSKKGKFEQAEGGTLFLDEIGNLTYEVQVKLLRALQEKIISPLGSNRSISVDVRIIAATNEALSARASQEKAFREDLYHRLNEFTLHIPALRQRPEDLPEFVTFFIEQANDELKKTVSGLSPETWQLLKAYDWPGNLRELRNVIKRAVLLTGTGLVDKAALPIDLAMQLYDSPKESDSLRTQREITERDMIIQTLRDCQFNKTKTAEKLNIDRKTLYNKMHRYDIE